jgi:hypothetical protein
MASGRPSAAPGDWVTIAKKLNPRPASGYRVARPLGLGPKSAPANNRSARRCSPRCLRKGLLVSPKLVTAPLRLSALVSQGRGPGRWLGLVVWFVAWVMCQGLASPRLAGVPAPKPKSGRWQGANTKQLQRAWPDTNFLADNVDHCAVSACQSQCALRGDALRDTRLSV